MYVYFNHHGLSLSFSYNGSVISLLLCLSLSKLWSSMYFGASHLVMLIRSNVSPSCDLFFQAWVDPVSGYLLVLLYGVSELFNEYYSSSLSTSSTLNWPLWSISAILRSLSEIALTCFLLWPFYFLFLFDLSLTGTS